MNGATLIAWTLSRLPNQAARYRQLEKLAFLTEWFLVQKRSASFARLRWMHDGREPKCTGLITAIRHDDRLEFTEDRRHDGLVKLLEPAPEPIGERNLQLCEHYLDFVLRQGLDKINNMCMSSRPMTSSKVGRMFLLERFAGDRS